MAEKIKEGWQRTAARIFDALEGEGNLSDELTALTAVLASLAITAEVPRAFLQEQVGVTYDILAKERKEKQSG